MRFTPPILLTPIVFAVLAHQEAIAQRSIGSYVRRAFDYRAVEAGVIGGPNRTSLTRAGSIDPEVRGMLGAFISVRLGAGFRLRPEALVAGKRTGATYSFLTPCLPPGPCPSVIESQRTTVTWLESPLLVEYRPGGFSRRFAPRLYAGPFLAIRVGCSLSTQTGAQPGTSRLVRACADDPAANPHVNNGDGGFVVGGGIHRHGVGLGLRWTRSLADLAPPTIGPNPNPSRLTGARQSTLTATLEFATQLW